MSERRLTTSQAAQRLGMDGEAGQRYVRRLIDDGRIRAVNVGFGDKRPTWRIPESEVDRFLREWDGAEEEPDPGTDNTHGTPSERETRRARLHSVSRAT